VVGLQFHIEWSEAALAGLIDACRDELAAGGRWVMSASEIEADAPKHIAENRAVLFALLDSLVAQAPADAGAEMQ
jgi:hypothetical protein